MKLPISIKIHLYDYGVKKRQAYNAYARIILHRIKAEISLKMSVDPNEWDFELEQMKPTKKHNIYCNGEIHSFKKRIFEIYDELVRNGETPSVGKIRFLNE